MPGSRGRRGIRTKDMLQIALQRIEKLFRMAEDETGKKNYERANRYAGLAAKIGTRYNVRIPKKYKLHFCRKCHAFLVPGKNSRVRLSRGNRMIHCNGCGWEYRVPYGRCRNPAAQRP
jgi:ribonuclease P protein subunit RPR2